ncbi:twin-arginine translocase subunit TatC [Devosia sp. RR2S18]|jgi:sec-independent protein translocase protein TatC|uniref:twin-arginine translocase subunit TatC n=1 Tax=Devosia rhizosphaerae TaxID=3049774 RepID=UPI0025409961|nr:twin-arginine translocase subunit TatC [Devosia sp. RR2S18]WIJ23745.1 twin-arginine translocase subunit TatC [Devosia sp. RR2S18]HEV7293161.1 twin-arginine translocase subunit TatC [Devosia sp.]
MADVKQIEDKSTEPEDELAGSEAPLLEHLVELRKRLIYSAIAIVVLMAGCFIFAGQIFDLLLVPYRRVFDNPGDLELIYTAPQEFFFTQLNLAFFGAIFLGFPFLASQIYMFMAPGLYKHERRAFIPYLIATPLFFILGAMMVYFVILPMALGFFAGMQTEEIRMLTKVSEYLSLAMTLILAFGVSFQLPVILTLLAQIDLVHVDMLKKGRRYAIVGILAFAAFITPPDPISQIGLAVPIYLLYELAILSVRRIEKKRAAADAAAAAGQS